MIKKNKINLIILIFLIIISLLSYFFIIKKILFSELEVNSSLHPTKSQENNKLDDFWFNQEEINFSSGFSDEQLKLALENYFLNQLNFSWKTDKNSWRYCTVKNLEDSNQIFPFDVWVYCGEYILENGSWQELSASSGPVKIDYPNDLTYFDFSRFSYKQPRNGTYYSEDIKNIFSNEVQKVLAWIDIATIMKVNRQLVLKNQLAWEEIKSAISKCQVKQVFQAHSLEVVVKLKNDLELKAREPEIDDIMDLVDLANCSNVIMSTE